MVKAAGCKLVEFWFIEGSNPSLASFIFLHLVELVDTIDLKSILCNYRYRFKSDSADSKLFLFYLKKIMQDFFKLSFKQLMLSNVFLGSRKASFNMIMKPFILGYRGSFCILNLSHTYIQFKLLVCVLFNIIFLRKNVLIVKENDLCDFKINLQAENLYFYDKK